MMFQTFLTMCRRGGTDESGSDKKCGKDGYVQAQHLLSHVQAHFMHAQALTHWFQEAKHAAMGSGFLNTSNSFCFLSIVDFVNALSTYCWWVTSHTTQDRKQLQVLAYAKGRLLNNQLSCVPCSSVCFNLADSGGWRRPMGISRFQFQHINGGVSRCQPPTS